MNNTQLYLSIGIPTLTVILAWLSNRSDINRLGDKLDSTTARLGERMDAMNRAQGERMDAMNTAQGERMDAMNKAQGERMDAMTQAHHDDMKMLMGYMVPLHERMAKLESRN
jgi:hypothetical protein